MEVSSRFGSTEICLIFNFNTSVIKVGELKPFEFIHKNLLIQIKRAKIEILFDEFHSWRSLRRF